MRKRSTWQNGRETSRQAATQRTADDIYDMNGDHPQPSPTEYENGNPDSWAETPASNDRVSEEYDGDHVKRNEIGLGEFRDDTWNGAGSKPWGNGKKYDNRSAADRKAVAAEKIASTLLRTGDKDRVRSVATAFMSMPDKAIVATLKAMDASSPNSLSQENRFKRAVACTKLAARILAGSTDEALVEKLARSLYKVDDSTLREIVKLASSVKVAQEEEQEEEEQGQQAQQQEQAQQQQAQQEQQAQEEEQEEEEQGQQAQQQEQAQQEFLSQEEEKMLDEMLKQEAHGPECGDDLSALFNGAPPPPAGVPAPAPASPMMASEAPAITFDDEEAGAEPIHSVASLEDLFASDPEVRAQREIMASQQGGFDVRTASSKPGARKLGNIQSGKAASAAEQLESIWDRPLENVAEERSTAKGSLFS